VYAEVPPRVEYALTPLGRTLWEPIDAIIKWSEENVGAIMAAQERYDRKVAEKTSVEVGY
jgi:DNA-binding HxlR family transcriptional regulator